MHIPRFAALIPPSWLTLTDYEESLPFSPGVIYKASLDLLSNPSIAFDNQVDADILFDTLGQLGPSPVSEQLRESTSSDCAFDDNHAEIATVPLIDGLDYVRSVSRGLKPRGRTTDKPLRQTCHFYASKGALSGRIYSYQEEKESEDEPPAHQGLMVVYIPHVTRQSEMPSYHPKFRGLACLYDFQPGYAGQESSGNMTLHILPFSTPTHDLLGPSLRAFFSASIRLARGEIPPAHDDNEKRDDSVVSHQAVQNTNARLHAKYAEDLCRDWAEITPPSKDVDEGLFLAAYLIELWRGMYGVHPITESTDDKGNMNRFLGFVDVACGTGVLVYVLLMEGYTGWGLDARSRMSWSIYPRRVQERLMERVYIPKPFANILESDNPDVNTYTGDFARDTFIISNHADELTVWTPLMAALACPSSPLPFIVIPCCSHSLSGVRHRYLPPGNERFKGETSAGVGNNVTEQVKNSQPASGDLKALRATKAKEKTDEGMSQSIYGSLTAKTMSIAEEIGYEVERTILQIPKSTRNLGIVGKRLAVTQEWKNKPRGGKHTTSEVSRASREELELVQKINSIVKRECSIDGGVKAAARTWIEHARNFHEEPKHDHPL